MFQSAFQNIQQTTAAGIYNACFLQYRQHIRCLVQHIMGMFQNSFQKNFDIVGFFRFCHSRFCTCSRYSQNGTFFGLHHCFVCSFHTLFHGCGQFFYPSFFQTFQTFGKAAENLRSDNAGVASGTAQRTARSPFCHFIHPQGIAFFCFSGSCQHSQRHIGSCVAIRHREYIHCIHSLLICMQFICARHDHSLQTQTV